MLTNLIGSGLSRAEMISSHPLAWASFHPVGSMIIELPKKLFPDPSGPTELTATILRTPSSLRAAMFARCRIL